MNRGGVPHVVIDARFLEAAGIGTYIENLVPRAIEALPEYQFTLLGDKTRLLDSMSDGRANVAAVECQASMYSTREQLLIPLKLPPDADLVWFPHASVPWLTRGRLLVTLHDAFHLAHPELLGSRLKSYYSRLLYRAVGRKSSHVLTVSSFSKMQLSSLAGIPPERITVTPLGVDESWFAVERPNPHPGPYIVFVGSVKPHKNLRTLVRAYRQLRERLQYSLVVVGRRDGLITSDPTLAADLMGLEKDVTFTGFVDKQTLQAYVAHADLLVHPSLYEGFGLTPLEAMAAGCPTVVAQAASLPEVCGDATVYFEPLDAADLANRMIEVLTDARLRNVLVARGRRRVQQFDWARTAAETARVLTTMVEGDPT